jgi:integrase
MLSVQLEDMTIDEVVEYITKRDNERIDFMQIFRDYIASHQYKKGIKNYVSALHSLEKFIGRDSMDIKEVRNDFLHEYAISLGAGRAPSLYLGIIRHVYAWAKENYNDEERGIIAIPYSPFSKFKVPKMNVAEKRALEVDQIRKIMELPYEDKQISRFNLAKDCFLLSFYLIGMNSADLYTCNKYENETIRYFREKTKGRRMDKAELHVDIQQQARELFDKYSDPYGKHVFRFYLMYSGYDTFNAAINKGLKEVGKAIGVEGLQFYAARHSWATIARNDLGIDKGTINDALNHVDESYSVTDLYIKKDFTRVNEANKKVLDYVFQ